MENLRNLKVAAVAINQTPLDWQGNTSRIIDCIRDAKRQEVSVLCFPELCISSYGLEDFHISLPNLEISLEQLLRIQPYTKGMIVAVGLPMYYGHAVYNAICLLVDGKIIGFDCKKDLAGDGVHYEARSFHAWPEGVREYIDIDDTLYPFGDCHFDIGGVGIGFEICEEAWGSRRRGGRLAGHVDIIMNPSASHFAFGKYETRKNFVREGSRSLGVVYIYANLLGNESGRIIFDGGSLIATNGTIVKYGERFSFADYVLTVATVDISVLRTHHARVFSSTA